jgi:hypothetical protein
LFRRSLRSMLGERSCLVCRTPGVEN